MASVPFVSNSGASNRRQFLTQTSIAAGALAAAGIALPTRLLGGSLKSAMPVAMPAALRPQTAMPVTDADILNFALNLEYLEANFYTVATTGKSIADIGIGTGGTGTKGDVTGGHLVPFANRERFNIAAAIAADEQHHVTLLRAALGSAAVAQPAINLDALGIGFDSQSQFLQLARAFEDTGVSAYGGAAPYVSSKVYLQVAARILAIEGQHTANIRLQLLADEIDNGVVGAIDGVDIPTGNYRYFSSNCEGLSVIRSPRQVLDIVFHSSGATSGGFFPNGVNSGNLAGLAAVPAPNEYVAGC